ncbi:MAG: hypothetical protein IJ735_05585 [Clostridia bacterium]|nr:hypothetical protein [Clostridia bacterium]
MSFLYVDRLKKALFVVLAALFVVLLCLSSSAFPAYAEDKETYVFDLSALSYRRDGDSVAFYYDGELDPDLLFSLTDSEGTRSLTDAFGDACAPGTATLLVVRPEDDRYETYYSDPIVLNVNTDRDVVILPLGQRRQYDGTTTAYEIGTFTQGEDPAVALHAGEYRLTLAYEEPIEVPYIIDKATVTVTADAYTRRYLDPGQPTELTVDARVSEEDLAYVLDNVVLTCPVQADSVPGEYPISLLFNGSSEDYDVVLVDSVCRVTGALLSGFSLQDETFLFDGKTHALTVRYDRDAWTDVTITYDPDGAKAAGKYRVTATVKKEYYEDLLLTATMTIRSTSIETSSTVDYARVTGAEGGYDPSMSVLLEPYSYDEDNEAIKSALAEKNGYSSNVISAYSLTFSEYVGGVQTVYLRPSVPSSASGVTLLQYRDGEVITLDYEYENGYFVVTTDYFDGFMFTRRVHVTHTSVSDIVVAVLIGAAILVVVGAVIGSFAGLSKKRRRSRRRHARWA